GLAALDEQVEHGVEHLALARADLVGSGLLAGADARIQRAGHARRGACRASARSCRLPCLHDRAAFRKGATDGAPVTVPYVTVRSIARRVCAQEESAGKALRQSRAARKPRLHAYGGPAAPCPPQSSPPSNRRRAARTSPWW